MPKPVKKQVRTPKAKKKTAKRATVKKKMGEPKDTLRRRAEWFRKRSGTAE
jgi:hypothetical protein